MTNKPNTDKTIEQLKQKMVSEIIETERRTGVGWGSDEALSLIIDGAVDAAIQLCEQRERDLVEALEWYANEKNWLPMDNTHWFDIMNEKDSELYPDGIKVVCGKRARLALKKHRGENETKL